MEDFFEIFGQKVSYEFSFKQKRQQYLFCILCKDSLSLIRTIQYLVKQQSCVEIQYTAQHTLNYINRRTKVEKS